MAIRPLSRSGPIVGIDLGTSYCCVAVWEQGRPVVVQNESGNRITPSCVAFTPSERLIGDATKDLDSACPQNIIYDAKRLMGRKFDDPIVQKDVATWPFKVVAGSRGEPLICVQTEGSEKQFKPEQISAMLLERMKEFACSYLECEVKDAVITVPAYFSQAQRQATKDAGEIAGLNVLRIVNEPTAAALAYGHTKDLIYSEGTTKTVLVFDLGGGTCDVSIMDVGGRRSTVRALSGDTHLGGVDFDTRLVESIMKRFKERTDVILKSQGGMKRLRRACVTAKHNLSARHGTSIAVDDLVVPLSRAEFEELNEDLFRKCMELVKEALQGAKMKASDISDVILVGGSTRIPRIQSLLTDLFGGRAPKKSVNADEAVACGAVVMAAILTGDKDCSLKDLTMVEVTALSLGVAIGNVPEEAWRMSTVIARNTPIPATGEEKYETCEDGQESIRFSLYEGERALCKDNHYLGKFSLDGFEPAPARVGKASLTLSVDEDGILHAEARNTASGRTSRATITMNEGRLTDTEIRRMVDEAQTYKGKDELAKKRWSARDELEKYCRSIRGRLSSVPCWNKNVIEKHLEELLTWLTSSKVLPTVEECEQKRKEMEAVWNCYTFG